MKPETAKQDPALDSMTLSILRNILNRTKRPAEMASYLTEEMRELTGARCVLLVRHGSTSDDPPHIFCVILLDVRAGQSRLHAASVCLRQSS